MSAGHAIAEAMLDCALLLRALAPAVLGVRLHDGAGRLRWSNLPDDQCTGLARASQAPATELVARGAAAPSWRWVRHREECALLWRAGPADQPAVAVLVVYFSAPQLDGEAPASLADRLRPVLNGVVRDLSHRERLHGLQERLRAQRAEDELVRDVEQRLAAGQDIGAGLQSLVETCAGQFGSGTAWLVLPDRDEAWIAGDGVTPIEARHFAPALMAVASQGGGDRPPLRVSQGFAWAPVVSTTGRTTGIFAVSLPEKRTTSDDRLQRLLQQVAVQVARALEREYDPVTQLLSPHRFEGLLARFVAEPARPMVLVLDIDQLHVINEALGHASGDDVLRRLARAMRRELPGDALMARTSADDFVAIVPTADEDSLRAAVDRIIADTRRFAYQDGERVYRAIASAGIAPLAADEDSASGLGPAQAALRAAKARGGGRVEVYRNTDASLVQRLDDLQIVGQVRQAIESDRLRLVAQRLLPLKNGQQAPYFEVLVRLVGESGELQPPGEFMSSAERYHLMEELDRWVVTETLSQIARRRDELARCGARFAVNLSGQSLGSEGFQAFVEAEIARSGVPPPMLTFEITETVAVTRMRQAQSFMAAVRRLGCRLSLDDFGTGLSSFAYLKLFPVDTLKIDGSFVRDLPTNVVSQSVVAAIGEVARVMRLDSVAEFVQDQATLDLLRQLNVGYAQGHFVGSTRPIEEQIRSCLDEAGAGEGAAAAAG